MPRFLYAIVISALVLWSLFFYLLFKVPPYSILTIGLFLLVTFLTFGVSSSLLLYKVKSKKLKANVDRRLFFRKLSKWSFYMSFGIVGFAFLKAFSLLTYLTITLFLLLYGALYLIIKNR
ncbi:hypothetical protein A3K34_04070 [candidate division WWE3 bacterium RIFOXYC1_FULL_40_10]|uniref:Major facilitator superfamily (MFS) profile domain-containing protein n=1 Tax=candidate division WWE3 bacterium RIFOXYA2_FULL_46_9 TaxID=1802636 RepID=A0A1F4W0I6_UNCKA|nr:MAG: hypothetical protein A3K58_04070 [candidate division WWE3 bacterium RIFOXYB1_FULL_40_22]OGC62017.1 MAG: hypothetical protein A3K37_04070 [candidate division WWE3 bacterium RIFOXYA1_FULL_40_11]OGC62934.1 MAG: hypothetical protein A2264_03585 [candidate division WWE3 bacterium RIFOXYA2_FULL_46_9]OGC65038.1 MAG: hypothetical protein A2326_03305 [candidate division WWE3 bacterium RIFOXYB2_FULL_41_6]OGC66400.1 MAG: hypothetical protein A3K34_04070 [candidate division WWE3 bacterium RIFOXYC1_